MNDEQPNEGTQNAPQSEAQMQRDEKKVLAILAYIGPLILVSYLLAKEDPFVKFHIKQGLLLVIGEVTTWLIAMMIWILFPLLQAINIFLFVLAIVGIIRAAHGEMKELPFIGKYAKRFNF